MACIFYGRRICIPVNMSTTMKNVTLIFVLLLGLAAPLSAQNWFQNKPHWVNFFSAGFLGTGYEYMTVENDTVLQGQPAVNLRRFHDLNSSNDFTTYRQARQQGDTIWVWHPIDSQFYVHYNFSLLPGDSVSAPLVWDDGFFRYYIDSIGTLAVAGYPLRFQRVRFSDDFLNFPCRALIIETIGLVNGEDCWTHFFPDEPNKGIVDGSDWRFCQYYNNQLAYNDGDENFCGALTSVNGADTAAVSLHVYPNPFQDAFSLLLGAEQPGVALRVFDAAGHLVLQTNRPSGPVATAAYPPGLYFLEVTLANGKRRFGKAVKR